jgi:glycosyltransferase involved in cell wall biosynthesis
LKRLLYIGNKLSKHGVTPTTIEILGPLLEQEGFIVFYSSTYKNKAFRLLDMIWSVFRYQKLDFVLIDTYSTLNFWYAFVLSQWCRMFNIRYIPILHGGNLEYRLQSNPVLCQMIFKNAFVNVSPSLFLKEKFKEAGFEKVKYIPNTITIENYSFDQQKKAVPNLLWVRSFAEIYNPMMAIEVFYTIKKEYPNATLCMVGPDKDGSLSKVKQKAKALHLDVLFPGKLSKKEWIALSKSYSIFVNTSHYDNMPVSIIEAMALGLAVVSTKVGGISYLLEDQKGALLIPDGDVEKMSNAILKLVENQFLFQKLVIHSRQKATEFDWENNKQSWFSILK